MWNFLKCPAVSAGGFSNVQAQFATISWRKWSLEETSHSCELQHKHKRTGWSIREHICKQSVPSQTDCTFTNTSYWLLKSLSQRLNPPPAASHWVTELCLHYTLCTELLDCFLCWCCMVYGCFLLLFLGKYTSELLFIFSLQSHENIPFLKWIINSE